MTKLENNNEKFLYVYDKKLAKYLRYECDCHYNCTGLHVKTHDQWYQFNKSDYLFECIANYKKQFNVIVED